MAYRPKRALILILIFLLAVGGIGSWAWKTMKPAPAKAPLSTEELAEIRKNAAVRIQKLCNEFPGLTIAPHPVPAEQNAFLMLCKLGDTSSYSEPELADDISGLIAGRIPWDVVLAEKCLAENQELVGRLEEIAALGTRSSSEMPSTYVGFIDARPIKEGADLLMLKARLSAVAGNESEALRLTRATMNIASHLHEIESPTLLCETVRILVELAAGRIAFEHILPSLGPGVDLGAWKSALAPCGYSPSDFVKAVRGEWHAAMGYYVPLCLRDPKHTGISERFIHVYSVELESRVLSVSTLQLADFLKLEGRFSTSFSAYSGLSKESRELLKSTFNGIPDWARGFVRAAAATAQYQAALDFLILEGTGVVSDADPFAGIAPDPVTRMSFSFDPATRMVSAPAATAAIGVEPLKLPW